MDAPASTCSAAAHCWPHDPTQIAEEPLFRGKVTIAALLCGEFQAQATLHLGIAVRELDEDHSQALWAERHQVVQGDGLSRRGHMVSGSRAPRTAGR